MKSEKSWIKSWLEVGNVLTNVIWVVLGHLGEEISQPLKLSAVYVALPSATFYAVLFLPHEVWSEIIDDEGAFNWATQFCQILDEGIIYLNGVLSI